MGTLQDIATTVSCLLAIPARLQQVVQAYLVSLMVDADKHSLRLAGFLSDLHPSQFSRLLSRHGDLAVQTLRTASQVFALRVAKYRRRLVPQAPWTVAIIVDAMFHPRSSPKLQGAKTLSSGKGFIVGHQWTNIVLVIGKHVVPLPPIPFLTRQECRRRGVEYRSSIEHLRNYLAALELSRWIGAHCPSEVCFMADCGYDDKKLKRLILDLGWDFIIGISSARGTKTSYDGQYRKIDPLFRAMRKQAPWQTVRFEVDGGKRRAKYRARKLTGFIRGVPRELALVCSEKATHKGRRFLACSNLGLDVGVILRAYRLRWQIELFHRSVKGQLGAIDVATSGFDSVIAHIHWVYCAYILLGHLEREPNESTHERQRRLGREVRAAPLAAALSQLVASHTQFGGVKRARALAAAALHDHIGLKRAS